MGSMVSIAALDGSGSFNAYHALPAGTPKGAIVVIQQFEIAFDGIRDRARIGGLGVGGIGETQRAVVAACPDWKRNRLGKGPQCTGFFQQMRVPDVQRRKLHPHAGKLAYPHNGLSADGPPHGFDGAP